MANPCRRPIIVPRVLLIFGLKLAHRVSMCWMRLGGRRQPSVGVAVWHDDRLLLVRHSYRPGYSLPGGLIGRGEAPAACAARELREEVGIAVPPDELVLVASEGRSHWFEYYPADEPAVRPDNIEVTEAEFVNARDARRHPNVHRYFRTRSRPPGNGFGGARPPA